MKFMIPSKLPASTALVLATLSLLAPVGSSAQSDSNLARQFRNNFERGCNQGSTPDVTNQKGYCTCMANRFEARYSGQELSAISQYASKLGQQGTAVINLMMMPEARVCTAKH